MIILPIFITSLMYFSFNVWENVHFELGSEWVTNVGSILGMYIVIGQCSSLVFLEPFFFFNADMHCSQHMCLLSRFPTYNVANYQSLCTGNALRPNVSLKTITLANYGE